MLPDFALLCTRGVLTLDAGGATSSGPARGGLAIAAASVFRRVLPEWPLETGRLAL
jgi:hypothetical protein